MSAEQKWKKSYVDDTEVWFTLQNPTSDKFLTAISDESTIISGKLYMIQNVQGDRKIINPSSLLIYPFDRLCFADGFFFWSLLTSILVLF